MSLSEELAGFPATSATHRLLTALFGVLPETPPPAWATPEDAAANESDVVKARAAELLADKASDEVVRVATFVDKGDTGLSAVTMVSSALGMLFGGGDKGVVDDKQQRTDAAMKALALAYVSQRLNVVLTDLPAGRRLLQYYGAIEIALPFRAELKEGFVQTLLDSQLQGVASKLGGLIGGSALEGAKTTLVSMSKPLDDAAVQAGPHIEQLTATASGLLPVLGKGEVPDLVATGADALPVYRLLVAQLAAEAAVHKARQELQPPASQEPALAEDPFADPVDPFADPAPAPEPADPFADPGDDPFADPVPAPIPVPVPEDPFADPEDPFADPEDELPPDPFADPEDDVVAGGAPPPPPPEAGGAPPPPPEPVQLLIEPIVPKTAAAKLEGAYQHGDDWHVFTPEGRYTDRPPAHPDPDWEAHARSGAAVGTYVREGNHLTLMTVAGDTTHHIDVQMYALVLDEVSHARSDFDLTGRQVEGHYTSDVGELVLSADSRFGTPAPTGRYALGRGAIRLAGDDGSDVVQTFYSDLKPSSHSPAVITMGGVRWTKK